MKQIISMFVLLTIGACCLPADANCQRITVYHNDPETSLQKRSDMIYGLIDVFSKPAALPLAQISIKKSYVQDIAPSGVESEKILGRVSGKALTYEEAICFINTVTASFSDDWYDGCGISFVMNYQGTLYHVHVDQWRFCSGDSSKWKWYLSAHPLKGSKLVMHRGIFIYT